MSSANQSFVPPLSWTTLKRTRPWASTVSGPHSKRLLLMLLNGLIRTPVPVVLFTRQTVPPAPGTYSDPLARAGWKTGSQKSNWLPAAFQSVVNCHCGTSVPPLQEYFVSPHVCVELSLSLNVPDLNIM